MLTRFLVVALLYSGFLPGQALTGVDLPTFRSDARFIAVDVQVLSGEQAVKGLTSSDFLVRDNGKRQRIVSGGADEQELDILLLLDVSGSTYPLRMAIKNAAAEAMRHLHFRDRVGIVAFSAEPFLIVPLTWDWLAVDKGLRKLPWLRLGTELNASTFAAAEYLRLHARPSARRAIVTLTDNRGMRAVSNQAVRTRLWEADAVLNLLLFKSNDSAGNADVRPFVEATGGDILPVSNQSLPLAEMFRRLRERYSLVYPAPDAEPGSTRTIRVDLAPAIRSRYKDLKIRARKGYIVGRPGSNNSLSDLR